MVRKDLVTSKLAELAERAAWVPAKSLAESFSRIEEHGVIGAPTADSLRRAVGPRNVVAHGYGYVDAKTMFAAATGGLAELDHFAREVAAWVRTRSTF